MWLIESQISEQTNAQSAGLRSLVAAESALQQPKQQMRNAVSKGPPLTYFRFAGDIYYVLYLGYWLNHI